MPYIGLILPATSLIILLLSKVKRDIFDNIFAIFLLYTIVNESISLILQSFSDLSPLVLYNIYSIVAFLFFISMFRAKIRSTGVRLGLFIAMAGLTLFHVVDSWFTGDYLTSFHYHTFVAGTIILLLTIVYYFTSLLESEEIIIFYDLRPFWVSLGLLSFYIPFTPLMVCMNLNIMDGESINKIIEVLNIIMHIGFWIGYTRKSTS